MKYHPEGPWPEAPRANTAAVCRPDEVPGTELLNVYGQPFTGRAAEVAGQELKKWREIFGIVKDIDIRSVSEIEAATKPELVMKASLVLSAHAAHSPKHRDGIEYAGLAGVGVIAAYLEMLARIQAKITASEFNEDLYRSAINDSSTTMLDMASRSNPADAALTASIMTWSPREVTALEDTGRKQEVYTHLQFDDSFFDIDEENGAVELKDLSDIHHRIKRFDGQQYDFFVSKKAILLGCPFRKKITALYTAMADAMINNGIAKSSFEAERVNASTESIIQAIGNRALSHVEQCISGKEKDALAYGTVR